MKFGFYILNLLIRIHLSSSFHIKDAQGYENYLPFALVRTDGDGCRAWRVVLIWLMIEVGYKK